MFTCVVLLVRRLPGVPAGGLRCGGRAARAADAGDALLSQLAFVCNARLQHHNPRGQGRGCMYTAMQVKGKRLINHSGENA